MRAILLILLLICRVALSADHCVRAGATGAGTGANWTDAFTALPATLIRGDTYYIADGPYSAYTFDDAVSGSARITITKATPASHGPETGWLDNYGDGQAEFTGQLTVTTGFHTFDGQTRGADWRSSYGLKVSVAFASGSFGAFRITHASAPVDSIIIRYVEMQGPSLSDSANLATAVYSFTPGTSSGLTIQNCWTHDFWPDVFIFRGDNITVEHSAIDPNFSTAEIHGQTFADHGCNNVVVRYNKVSDPVGTAVYTVIGNGQTESGLKIYGNAIFAPAQRSFPDGISKFVSVISPATVSSIEVYNNTLVNIGWSVSLAHADATGANRVARNNLFYNCGSTSNLRFDSDYNFYHETGHTAEANEQIGSAEILVSPSNNFHLSTNTVAGAPLGSEFNTDLEGRTRSSWSRGAYEFHGSLSVGTFNVGPP